MDKQKLEIESLIYRINKLDEKYDRLKNLISGTGEKYVDLLKTKSGKYSSKKINQMASSLTECLKEYRMYMDAIKGGHLSKMKDQNLPKEDIEFYNAYFYLMLGFAAYNNSDFALTRYFEPGTWDALLDRISEEIEYRTDAELDADILVYDLPGLYPLRVPAGLIADICVAYKKIANDDFSSLLSEDERKAAFKLMSKKEISYIKNPKKKITDEEKEAKENEAILDLIFEDPDYREYIEDLEYLDNLDDSSFDLFNKVSPLTSGDLSRLSSSIEEWEDYFSDKNLFKTSCTIVKKGITERNKKGYTFRREIKMAIELYLWKNGISEISDDEKYLTVYAYLNKAVRASEMKLSELNKKN